jgi:NhaP-type Na+/H+ or K+/H+ antiporter
MLTLLVFAVVLMGAVLLSSLAERSVLSTAVLFLAAGFACGPAALNLVNIVPAGLVITRFVELALFSVLFTDGMNMTTRRLREVWRLPGRALLIGLPFTLLLVAAMARALTDLNWTETLLLGAALSPTDPVFAGAIIGAPKVPRRLRELLNVESGLNDGLALPLVVGLLSISGPSGGSFGEAVLQALLGVAIGIAVPVAAVRLNRTRLFGVSQAYAPIGAFAVGLLVLSIASLTEANVFLAAFTAGMTLATIAPAAHEAFEPLGEPVSEMLKLSTLLLFGASMSMALWTSLGVSASLFVVFVLLIARPAAIALSLLRTELSTRETIAAAWFGPKGFASVFFAFLILHADIPRAHDIFQLVAAVVTVSIVAHSSTDVLVARWFSTPAPS